METAILKPFIRYDLDILFVGLNPAIVSNHKGHYFSVKQSFWTQLYEAGLITSRVDKDAADEIIFGDTKFNLNNFDYGITDLVTNIAESDSSNVKPTLYDCRNLEQIIREYRPKVVIILHNKVKKMFVTRFLKKGKLKSNYGNIGRLLNDCETIFYNIAFPHNNNIKDEEKIRLYREVKNYITKTNLSVSAIIDGRKK